MGVFVPLGSIENSMGKEFCSCLGKSSGVSVVFHSTGELSLVGENQKSAVIRLDFRLQNNLLGNFEKLDGFHRGLIV